MLALIKMTVETLVIVSEITDTSHSMDHRKGLNPLVAKDYPKTIQEV